MKNLSKLQKFNIIFFGLVIVLCIILTIVLKFSFLALVACISGIMYMAFLSDRNFLNFIIGFISSTTYIIIAYQAKLYGEAIFYLFFDLPMILVSYLFWRKHHETKFTVYPRKLNAKNTTLICIVSLASVVGYGFLLKAMGDVSPFIDATSTVISFIATILMTLRYREQWIMWIIVYVNGILLWVVTFDLLMLIMAICCFISSLLGYISWSRSQKIDESDKSLKLLKNN